MSEEGKAIPPKKTAAEHPDVAIKREMAKRTRRSFIVGGAAAAAGYGFYHWIDKSEQVGLLQAPLRKAEEFNADLSRALFREKGMAPEYEKSSAVGDLRFNGKFGLDTEMKLSTWRLQMVGLENPKQYKQYTDDVDLWEYESGDSPDSPQEASAPSEENSKVAPGSKPAPAAAPANSGLKTTPGILLTLDDIRALPHRDLVVQFKCIEGWSEIVHWGGARCSDLIAAYPPAKIDGADPKYVYMETADGQYFVGLDYASVMHPQSMLVYEMSGAPLNVWHGAPLRLAMPLKYGYKQIKQVAKIEYTNTKPKDYWTALGYDWYAGF